ncbi:MAG: hypothetical protein KJ663_03515 [Proteobacteria bacterium]|nr:hypothetical protein [Pseudomonadota bacterium]
MKRAFLIIIPILLVVSFIVYAVNSHRAYKAKIEAKKTQKAMIEKNVISAVANLLKKHNAFDWVKEIEGRKELRDFTPILTVELEKLWLTDRPTLFIGTIEDISTLDQEYYILKLQGIGPVMVNFELKLKCPMQKVKSLLKEHPDLTRGVTRGVAVIANIDNIKTVISPGYEGGKEDIRIGEGKSIDIVYVDDIWIWYHLER